MSSYSVAVRPVTDEIPYQHAEYVARGLTYQQAVDIAARLTQSHTDGTHTFYSCYEEPYVEDPTRVATFSVVDTREGTTVFETPSLTDAGNKQYQLNEEQSSVGPSHRFELRTSDGDHSFVLVPRY